MNDAKRKVLDMVEQGRISPAEGGALLTAMEGRKGPGFGLLLDPHERLGTVPALAIGAAVAVASAGVAVSMGVRFDGFMDIHTGGGQVLPLAAAIDQLVAWPVSALLLWLCALPFTRQARYIDFLAALGVARVIQLVAGLALAPLSPGEDELLRMAQNPVAALHGIAGMLPMIIVALALVSWFVAALVFAFRHASGLRRGRLAGAFVLALFVTEAASKAILFAVGQCHMG
ncbi:MAG TPA: hypothetical protein VM285_07665 [Polyangia bacterium]|nr:hypothetical protein [Polyangia bacterium]